MFDLIPGETASVKIGDVGRPVVGKVVVPEGLEVSNGSFNIVRCVPAGDDALNNALNKNPRERVRTCGVDPDGTF